MPKASDMEHVPEFNYGSFLADAMRDYLDYLDHLGFSIVGPAYNLRRIDRFLVENHIGSLRECDSQLWIRLAAQYQIQVKAPTLKRWQYTYQGFFRYLLRLGYISHEPAAALALPRPQDYRPHVFSLQELRRLFDYLRQQADQSDQAFRSFRFRSRYVFYHLLYACGLRVSEAIRLSVTDYSAGQRTLFIRPSKFLKDRLVPIGRRTASNLDSLLELRHQMFGIPSRGALFLILPQRRPHNRNWVSACFRATLRHLGIYHPEITYRGCTHGTPHLHELRRAFAVHRLIKWYRQGVDVDAKLPLLATYMGHSCFAHTKTYLTLTQELLSEARNRFARSFDDLDWLKHDDPEL